MTNDWTNIMRRNWLALFLAFLAAAGIFTLLDILLRILLIACMQASEYWVMWFSHTAYRYRHGFNFFVCLIVFWYLFCWLKKKVLSVKIVFFVFLLPILALSVRFETTAIRTNEMNEKEEFRTYDFRCTREGSDIFITNENIENIDIDENGPESCLMSIYLSETGKQFLEGMKNGEGSGVLLIYIDGRLVAEEPVKKVKNNSILQFPVDIRYEDQRIWDLMNGILRKRMLVK